MNMNPGTVYTYLIPGPLIRPLLGEEILRVFNIKLRRCRVNEVNTLRGLNLAAIM